IAAERLLDDLRPELVLFLERNYAAEAPISDVALVRGTNVVQYVSGPQDDTLVFKRFTRETRRDHPRSLSEASWEAVRRMPWTPEHDAELDQEFAKRYGNAWALSRRIQGWTTDQSRDEVIAALGLDPTKKTAVLYSHILWDANMFYGEDLYADQEEWFVETVRAARRTRPSTGSSSSTRRTSGSSSARGSRGRAARRRRSARRSASCLRTSRSCGPTARSRPARSSGSRTTGSRFAARSGSSCRASA